MFSVRRVTQVFLSKRNQIPVRNFALHEKTKVSVTETGVSKFQNNGAIKYKHFDSQ